MSYFKDAETLLSSVPLLEKALQNLKEQETSLRKVEAAPLPRGGMSTKEAERVLSDRLERKSVKRRIKRTSNTLSCVNRVLDQLGNEEAAILRSWYIDHKPKETILSELHIESLSTLYNLRNTAVTNFALLYYGAEALGVYN